MVMLYFENDYSEGAHGSVLKRLIETNMESSRDTGRTATRMRPGKRSGPRADARMRMSIC